LKKDFAMKVPSALSLCAAATGTAALQFQIPLLSSHNQAPLETANEKRPLVNSSALQDVISGDRLFARAKKLYEVAKLGEHEYNHPTRVIGSAGKDSSMRHAGIWLIIIQDTLVRYRTSMRLFCSLEITIRSLTSRFPLCQVMFLKAV
jgi:hypothetical protein